MSTATLPSDAPVPSQPAALRDRIRLLALLGMVLIWMGPDWVQVDVGGVARWEKGAVRTGVAAALALIALWGLSATSLASRSLRGLRVGSALTDAVLALTTALLMMAEHTWIPGGDLREAWVPIFLPLCLLALLDAGVQWKQAAAGSTVTVIRGGAALFACVALAADGSWIPAGIALWLAIAALAFVKTQAAFAARRILEGLTLTAGAIAGLAPWIQRDLVGANLPIGPELTWPIYVWCVLAALVVTTALDGVMRPESEAAPAGAR